VSLILCGSQGLGGVLRETIKDPSIPYAWQEPGTVIEIPVQKYGRMNVLGFMNRKNDLHPFIFEQSVHTGVVIACFEEFSKTLKKNSCGHG